jgi:hypothetical protein
VEGRAVSAQGAAGRGVPDGAWAGAAWRRLAPLFAIDPRSLAVFRIALGGCLLAILAGYADAWGDLLAPDGPVPVQLLRAGLPSGLRLFLLPFELAPGFFPRLLFALLAGAGVLLVLGLYSRAACGVAWLGVNCLLVRGHFAQDYGDQLLVRLLFWSLFLPLGARFSLDAHLGRVQRSAGPVLSLASAALLIQVAATYLLAGLAKTGPEWRDGSAVTYVMSQSYWATPRSAWLLAHPGLASFLTRLTPWLEIALAGLLFSPLATPWARGLAVAALAGFHASLAAAITLGVAPFVSISGALAFLPGRAWERVGLAFGAAPPAEPRGERAPGAAASAWRRRARVLLLVPFALLLLNFAAGVRARPAPGADAPLAGPWRALSLALHLTQSWDMYAPGVDRDDGWFSAAGTLASGRPVDVLRGGEAPSLTPPAELPWAGASLRWGILRESVRTYPAPLGASYLDWLCRRWNAAHSGDERLVALRLDWVRIDRADDPHGLEPRRRALAGRRCAAPESPPR